MQQENRCVIPTHRDNLIAMCICMVCLLLYIIIRNRAVEIPLMCVLLMTNIYAIYFAGRRAVFSEKTLTISFLGIRMREIPYHKISSVIVAPQRGRINEISDASQSKNYLVLSLQGCPPYHIEKDRLKYYGFFHFFRCICIALPKKEEKQYILRISHFLPIRNINMLF